MVSSTYTSSFDFTQLKIQLNQHRKPLVPENELVFGKHFTDHMVTIEWNAEKGWSNPIIKPYGKLELEPSSVVFHYGFEVNPKILFIYIDTKPLIFFFTLLNIISALKV